MILTWASLSHSITLCSGESQLSCCELPYGEAHVAEKKRSPQSIASKGLMIHEELNPDNSMCESLEVDPPQYSSQLRRSLSWLFDCSLVRPEAEAPSKVTSGF